MHIAIFVDFHDSAIGGVTTSVRGQRKGLEDLGHKVTIVCPPPVGDVAADPAVITIPAVPLFRPNGFPMVAPTKRNVRLIEEKLDATEPVDIIHVQTNMGIGMMGVRIAQRRKIPLVQTMHGRDDVFAENTYPFPTLITALMRMAHARYVPHVVDVPKLNDSRAAHNAWQIMVNHAQSADYVVMPSHHFMVKFREHGVTKPITVISNGISDDAVKNLPHVLRKQADVAAPLHIGWCGRLSHEKRPLESIQAVAAIEGAQLDMYGSGPLEKMLQDYITEHKLTDRIHLKGRVSQDEVLRAMQTYDALLYASYGFDNQPMVILEAVAAGLPIVYCDPDLTECMPDGGGLITDGITVEAMKSALMRLQNDPALRQKMHVAMYDYRDKIVQSYHSKKMVDLYKSLISQK